MASYGKAWLKTAQSSSKDTSSISLYYSMADCLRVLAGLCQQYNYRLIHVIISYDLEYHRQCQTHKPFEKVAKTVMDDHLAAYIFSGKNTPLGNLEFSKHVLKRRMQTVLMHINDNMGTLNKLAQSFRSMSDDNLKQLRHQNEETDQLAQLSHQITQSAETVLKNTKQTSHAATEAQQGVELGHELVANTASKISDLASELSTTSAAVTTLAEETESIKRLLDTINSQTRTHY
jgi:aerotaxis receptor